AARISQGWLAGDSWKARAVPWKLPWMVAGMPMRAIACCTASVACDDDTLGGRLNESVLATNWLWWFTDSAVLVVRQRAMAESGTRPLLAETSQIASSPSGLCQ